MAAIGNFSYFWSTSHPDALYQVWSQLAFRFRRSKKIDFQDGRHGHLGFPIETILAIFFFFLSTSHHDASYQVSSQLDVDAARRTTDSDWPQ